MSKKVLCRDCGFLCWAVSYLRDPQETTIKLKELSEVTRRNIADGKLKGNWDDTEEVEHYRIICFRRQWFWGPGNKDPRYKFIGNDELNQPTKCHYFTEYEPACGPEEHKQLRRERDVVKETRNAILWGAAVGGAMGAGGAIAAQLIYAAVTSG